MEFNISQQEAINFEDGICLVNSGPGSGKTSVVVERIINLLNKGVKPYSILATTFTKRAATEMNKRLKAAGINTKTMSVQTSHSFCYQIIRDNANLDKDWKLDLTDKYKYILKDVIGYRNMDWRGVDLTEVMSFVGLCKNALINPEDAIRSDIFDGFSREENYVEAYFLAEEIRLSKKIYTFDDLHFMATDLIESDSHLRENLQYQYEYVIVDEYQDSNDSQLKLFDLIAAPQFNLFCVGDVDQSIYRFRGSKPEIMANFNSYYDNTKTISMGQNYRSAKNIVCVADRLIKHNKERIDKELIPTTDGVGLIIAVNQISQDNEANYIAEKIKKLTLDYLKYSEIYVLYRTNAQSRAIEEHFKALEIPFTVLNSVSFYKRKEIKNLIAYLRVLDDPTDYISGRITLMNPFRYIKKDIIEEIVSDKKSKNFLDSVKKFDNVRLQRFLKLFEYLKSHDFKCVGEILKYIVDDTNYLRALNKNESDTPDNPKSENVGELIRSATRFETINEFLEFVEKQNKPKRPKKNSVLCMSIHRAKGLENKAVFIIGANEGIIPHEKSSDIEEERRLFYVAMTRAMEYLHITYLNQYGRRPNLDASRFLVEMGLVSK